MVLPNLSRARASGLLMIAASSGCAGPDIEVGWMEGFSYSWELFNHRLSFVHADVAPTGASVAVIGGTSTTGYAPDLADGCDAGTCDEFPFYDDAAIKVGWGRAVVGANRWAVGTATASLIADADGESATLQIPLEGKARGTATAILVGLELDTDEPLDGAEACYRPGNGWHPRRIAVSLGEPIVSDDGQTATVEVQAAFEAGNSLEDVRACVDEVADRARVATDVTVLVVVGKGDATATDVTHGATYAWSGSATAPEAQDSPDPSSRPWDPGMDAEGALAGWSAIDFAFHVDDPDDRGAYLRSWSFAVDPVAGAASGHATNHSPGTQLSGFDYTFSGTARAVDLGVDVERGNADALLPAALDESFAPVITELAF